MVDKVTKLAGRLVDEEERTPCFAGEFRIQAPRAHGWAAKDEVRWCFWPSRTENHMRVSSCSGSSGRRGLSPLELDFAFGAVTEMKVVAPWRFCWDFEQQCSALELSNIIPIRFHPRMFRRRSSLRQKPHRSSDTDASPDPCLTPSRTGASSLFLPDATDAKPTQNLSSVFVNFTPINTKNKRTHKEVGTMRAEPQFKNGFGTYYLER